MSHYNIVGSDTGTSTESPVIEQEFLFIAPINLLLSVFILFTNSSIVRECKKEHRVPSKFLFLVIAISDMIMAVAEIPRSTVAIVCHTYKDFPIPSIFTLFYVALGFWGYNFSIFTNVMLSVVKSFVICNPFSAYLVRRKYVIYMLAAGALLWLSLSVSDAVIYAQNQEYLISSCGCGEQWSILEDYDFIGNGFALDVFVKGERSTSLALKLIVTAEYLIPCVIILISMILQLVYVSKTIQSKTDASQYNITIIIVSTLYLICNSAYGIFFLTEFSMNHAMTRNIEFLMKYTLPLFNAAAFPVVLIFRQRDLKMQYLAYWNRMTGFVTKALTNVSVREDQQYETVPGEDREKSEGAQN